MIYSIPIWNHSKYCQPKTLPIIQSLKRGAKLHFNGPRRLLRHLWLRHCIVPQRYLDWGVCASVVQELVLCLLVLTNVTWMPGGLSNMSFCNNLLKTCPWGPWRSKDISYHSWHAVSVSTSWKRDGCQSFVRLVSPNQVQLAPNAIQIVVECRSMPRIPGCQWQVSKWKRCYAASDMWSLGATFYEACSRWHVADIYRRWC